MLQVFSTVHLLTKNKGIDESWKVAVIWVVLEFLQLFRVLFNSSWPWKIQQDLWLFRAIEWLLFRMLVLPKGYASYITCFYTVAALALYFVAEVWPWQHI